MAHYELATNGTTSVFQFLVENGANITQLSEVKLKPEDKERFDEIIRWGIRESLPMQHGSLESIDDEIDHYQGQVDDLLLKIQQLKKTREVVKAFKFDDMDKVVYGKPFTGY
jgi:hypothetical protein